MAGERHMDRHVIPSEFGYLLSGLWKGKGEGGRGEGGRGEGGIAERNRERQRGEGRSGENGARQKLPLCGRDRKEKRLRLEGEDQPQQTGREWAWLVS